MWTWYQLTPEISHLVTSTCCTLPLMFSLWLMMTKEDRELMLHPSRFRANAALLNSPPPAEIELGLRLKSQRVRMGVELSS